MQSLFLLLIINQVANLSISDLRGLNLTELHKLQLPVCQYLIEHNQHPLPSSIPETSREGQGENDSTNKETSKLFSPIVCTPNTPFETVVLKLAATGKYINNNK